MIKNEHSTLACLLSPLQVDCHPLCTLQAEVKRLSCLIYADCTLRWCHVHSYKAELPKSACGKEYRNSKIVIGRKRRLNSSKAITKINGVLKLNGDCPLSN